MSVATTSQLLVELNLAGNFNSGITSAESRLSGFGNAAVGGFGKVETAAGRVGGALSHAGGQIKSLVTGPLGMLGLGAGLFTLGGAIERAISRATAFGDEVRAMSAVTGLSAETTSALASALEHFGIGADKAIRLTGFLEKNVGLLAAKKDGVVKFEKEFSFALTDANGHLKDANQLILTSADYFNNKSIPATEKAAALSKLYGRSWQDLIPILKAGRQGIADAEAEAKSLGLTLTGANVKALGDLKTATRDWNTALGGLELQIGLQLVPTLTKFARGLTQFVKDNGPQITKFFGDLGRFAGDAAGTIVGTAHTISGLWNGIPKPFRDLLTTGLVADRTIKFLFGFDPVKAAGGLLGAGFNQFFQRGSSPANPLWVAGTGIGGGGGGGGVLSGGPGGIFGRAATGLGGALGGGAVLGAAAIATSAAILVASLAAVQNLVVIPDLQRQQNRNNASTNAVIATGDAGQIGSALNGIRAGIDSLNPFQRALYELNADGAKTATESLIAALQAAFDKAQTDSRRNLQPLPEKISKAQERNFNTLRDRIEASRIATQTGTAKVASRVDTENAAITRAIHAQKLAVHLSVINKTTVSVTDVNNAIRSHSIYSTGMRGAMIGSGIT